MSATDDITDSRPASEVLAWCKTLVDPALRDAVGRLPPSMRDIAGYHFGWWDEHGRSSDTGGGKALRPALVLLAASAVGGAPTAAVPAAVGVELVHNFSLLHDDVMDGDATRRHRLTAWWVYGSGSAILAGDALLTLACDVLASSGNPAAREGTRQLNSTVLRLIDGQSADLAFEPRVDVGVEECLSMVSRKTASLLGCAGHLGALFGGAEPERAQRLRSFGSQLGMAFQLVDDLLGIWGAPETTGKPAHSDLRNRKKSLPVVVALASDAPAGRELAALYGREPRDEPLDGTEVPRAKELVENTGAWEWSLRQVDQLLANARRDLDACASQERAAAELATLASMATTERAPRLLGGSNESEPPG